MKKHLIAGAVTITLALSSQQPLSAWINSQFGVGMNWHWQSGGNSIGHGLYRDGQPGGPEFYHQHTTVPAYPKPLPCPPQPCPQPIIEKHSYHVLPQPHCPTPYAQPAPHYAQPAPQYAPAPQNAPPALPAAYPPAVTPAPAAATPPYPTAPVSQRSYGAPWQTYRPYGR